MGIKFDHNLAMPADEGDDICLLAAFQEMVKLGFVDGERHSAYFSNGDEYMIESPYWNISIPPEWATHVVYWENK